MMIPFKKEHLECMEIREHERAILAQDVHKGEGLEQSVIARTVIVNGQIVACYGIAINVFGSGDVWLIPSIHLPKHRITFLRYVTDLIRDWQAVLDIKRMQTASPDDVMHNRYMKFLGFECEGTMKKYALGVDYKMWGRLWE